MSRLATAFQKRQPFIGYLTGGDGGIEYSTACALALLEGGVDILEIGLPFSDPVADGPVIERAHKRALSRGITASSILEIARSLRKSSDAPLIAFSYYNPLLQQGEGFLHQLKEAGYDALLIVDLPAPDDPATEPFFQALKRAGLHTISLVTPSTPEERLIHICKSAEGFVYYVMQKGTTGVRSKLADDFSFQIARIRRHARIPLAGGFGIADRASAKAALAHADGFVVGSAFVKLMEKEAPPEELRSLAEAIDPRRP